MKLWKVSNDRWYRDWEEGDTKWEQAIFVIAKHSGDAIKIARKRIRKERKEYVDGIHDETPRYGKDPYMDAILSDRNLTAEEVKDGCTEPLRV